MNLWSIFLVICFFPLSDCFSQMLLHGQRSFIKNRISKFISKLQIEEPSCVMHPSFMLGHCVYFIVAMLLWFGLANLTLGEGERKYFWIIITMKEKWNSLRLPPICHQVSCHTSNLDDVAELVPTITTWQWFCITSTGGSCWQILLPFTPSSSFLFLFLPIKSSFPLCPPTHCQLWEIWWGGNKRKWKGETENTGTSQSCLWAGFSGCICSSGFYIIWIGDVWVPVNHSECLRAEKISSDPCRLYVSVQDVQKQVIWPSWLYAGMENEMLVTHCACGRLHFLSLCN